MSGRAAFMRFALPLAAIPAIAKLAGLLLMGVNIDGVLVRPAPWLAAAAALLTYGLDLLSVFVLGLAIHVFAAVFDGEQEKGPAMKLAVVSAIPGWIGGIFLVLPSMGVVPPLGVLSALFTLYGLYILYLGLPPVMHVRQDKAPVYAGVAILVFLALWGVDSLATSSFDHVAMMPAPGATLYAKGVQVDPGRAKRELESALKGAGPPPAAVRPDDLETLLPAALEGDFVRKTVTSSSAHLGKLSGAMAQGAYVHGGDTINLSIADIGAVGGLADAVKLATNKHSDTGYQKAGQVDGRMTLEKYDRPTNTGEYDVLVANRFLIQAKGRASVETLQRAVKATDFTRLEAMAKG